MSSQRSILRVTVAVEKTVDVLMLTGDSERGSCARSAAPWRSARVGATGSGRGGDERSPAAHWVGRSRLANSSRTCRREAVCVRGTKRFILATGKSRCTAVAIRGDGTPLCREGIPPYALAPFRVLLPLLMGARAGAVVLMALARLALALNASSGNATHSWAHYLQTPHALPSRTYFWTLPCVAVAVALLAATIAWCVCDVRRTRRHEQARHAKGTTKTSTA